MRANYLGPESLISMGVQEHLWAAANAREADHARSPQSETGRSGHETVVSVVSKGSGSGSARSHSSDDSLDARPSAMLRGPAAIDDAAAAESRLQSESADQAREADLRSGPCSRSSGSRSPRSDPQSPQSAPPSAGEGLPSRPESPEATVRRSALPVAGQGGAGELAAERPQWWDRGRYSGSNFNEPELCRDWGASSPPVSARRDNLEGPDATSTDTSCDARAQRRSPEFDGLARGGLGALSEHSERDSEGPNLPGLPKAWNELYADLCAVSSLLNSVREVRRKQQEYLQQLTGVTAASQV